MTTDTDFGYFKRADTIVVRDDATAEELCAAIAALRGKAQRLSRHDPRRDGIDEVVDGLVDRWLGLA